ncbi:MAG: glycosyltransferase [Pseudomonadota bacterium]
MTRVNLPIIIAVAVVSLSLWAMANRPEQHPPWPSQVHGFSFSPYRADQDAIRHILPAEEEIDEDLRLLANKARAVRTYSTEGSLAAVPFLALRYNIKVTVGAWISEDLERNEEEIAKAIELANAYPNVVRVIVGNEVLLHQYIPKEQLVEYIQRVRTAVKVPVSTAEPWHVWVANADLVSQVDYIATHMLPYWEKQHVDHAVGYVKDKMDLLHTLYEDKEVIIGEVGWPSNGRTRGGAEASTANQAAFLRDFLALAASQGYQYYIMEAFDQPWKAESSEGAVGAYWGVYNVERQPKFPWYEPVVEVPHWYMLAGLSIVLAIIVFSMLLIDGKHLGTHGRSFLAVIAYAVATAVVWVAYDYANQYLTFASVLIGLLLVVGMIGVIVVLLTEAHEWAEVRWSLFRRRAFQARIVPDHELPFVSIHVPCYNEPPAMMIQTLDALARLDYPDFEVLVIDNNTKDPAVWQPVQAHCERLGARFRFFHVDPLAGFKAGALNFALHQTDARAEIVAVIDSDYQVASNWLRDLVPQFANPRIGVVQAPQDYRDGGENLFKKMCYSEYAGFFYIGMVTRNERNAIIQHGTMTMIRRHVLRQIGGWAEWCITEDAELGLRIFEHGYEAVYIPKSYGRGLMPDTFIDYKKQRFRWAFGAMQILRGHLRELLGKKPTQLTSGQRYHFMAGWLPWIADGFNLVFNLLALGWSLCMILMPETFSPPLIIFSLLPLALFVFKSAKQIYLYQTHAENTLRGTFAATIAGLALSHTISKAILSGFITRNMPFFRTPKMASRLCFRSALMLVYEEALLALAFILAVIGVLMRQGADSPDILFWVVVLCVQTIPYLSAIFMSLLSAKVNGQMMTIHMANHEGHA